jgi:hypothetical protein
MQSSGSSQMFQRNILPPPSEMKSKPTKKPAKTEHFLPHLAWFTETVCSSTTLVNWITMLQLFIATAIRTSGIIQSLPWEPLELSSHCHENLWNYPVTAMRISAIIQSLPWERLELSSNCHENLCNFPVTAKRISGINQSLPWEPLELSSHCHENLWNYHLLLSSGSKNRGILHPTYFPSFTALVLYSG